MSSNGGCSQSLYGDVLGLLGGDTAAAQAVCSQPNVSRLDAQAAINSWSVGQLRSAQNEVAQLQDQLEQVGYGLDVSFVLTSAYQVFVMQLGFALFAAGVVRPKNIVAIFLKNFFDTCIAGIAFYLVGYAFAFGAKDGSSNGFIGNWDFALSATDGSPGQPGPEPWQLFIWNWTFCSAATTILSGSIAERATFASYTIYAAFMPAWVYPVVAHWLWSPHGWLSARNAEDRILGIGAIDFAGSGVVHLVGGVAALVGSIVTGPRVGRFGGNGISTQLYRASAAPQLYLMGTFLLWFGGYGFNPGSQLKISNYSAATIVSRIAVTTTLSACAGALMSLLLAFWRHRVWDLLSTCLGALAGLVSVTAGCAVLEPWAAIICGLVAAFICEAGDQLLERFRVDDPVMAFPLHGLCGVWGLLYVGLMAQEDYIYQVYHVERGHHRMGLFYGGHAQLLLCQVIAVASIAGWSSLNMAVLFGGMKLAGILRVAIDKEATGMDLAVCGHLSAIGAVNVHSSKVLTKCDVALASVSLERRQNGGPGLDLSVRPPPSNNPSVHQVQVSAVKPEPLSPNAVAAAPNGGVGIAVRMGGAGGAGLVLVPAEVPQAGFG